MNQQKKRTGITVFYSYTSADKELRDQLANHLSQLKRDELICEFYDQQIPAGSDRTQAIDQMIQTAHIILLLVSSDFLAEEPISQIEMSRALERHRRGEARVVPLIMRPCDWQHSSFAHLQCLPRSRQPITVWPNQDEAFVAIAEELRQIITQEPFFTPPLSSMQRQHRERLLKRVRATWIEGLLEDSLRQSVWIDLHLQEQTDALENPWRMQVQELDREPHVLPDGTSIVQVYDEAEGELLILGEPGSGKTTLLLELTRTLLDRAEADEQRPMPIVFNLSSWAGQHKSLASWLVEELKTKYHIPAKVGAGWIETNQVLPLLDGLDEVAEEVRVACVEAVRAYYHHPNRAGVPLVLCCRSEEYRVLNRYLPLKRAISILPLSDEQVDIYLSHAQGQLEGLRDLLDTDANFAAHKRRPLVLSIAALAFQGKRLVNFPSEDNFPASPSQEELLRMVFSAYVTKMLSRRKELPVVDN